MTMIEAVRVFVFDSEPRLVAKEADLQNAQLELRSRCKYAPV